MMKSWTCHDNRLILIFLILISWRAHQIMAQEVVPRKLNALVNPGCEQEEYRDACNNTPAIIYVTATGSSDVLHFLSSTLGGTPCILMVKTSLEDQLKINWTLLERKENNAIKFDNANFSYGLMLNKLWQFNDTDDSGHVSNVTQLVNLTALTWNDANYTTESSDDVISVTFNTANGSEGFSVDGSLSIKVSISGKAEYSDDFPHLKYTGTSAQLRFIVDKMKPYFNCTRLGMEFAAVTKPNENEEWQEEKTKSLDDEYTPGVFATYLMTMPRSQTFLYWKPLTYTSPDHTVMNTTDVVLYDIVNDTEIFYSVVSAYFNDTNDLHKAAWNMTFGSSKDGFYTKTNYSSWSLMTGLGQPPLNEISTVAIIFIAVGLGLPALLMLSGGIFLGWKRLTRKEDDLLLSRYSIQ